MSYYEMARPEIISLVPDKKINTVLDVGCGAGVFGATLKKKYACTVTGIEPVLNAAEKAATLLDKIYSGFFEDVYPQISQQFDLIFFNDVLEHMVDPYNVLTLTKNLLQDDGLVIASLPNILHYQEFFDILKNKDFRYANQGIMDKTHLRWFTRKSMIRMFEESGYQVEKITGLDPTPSMKMRLLSLCSFGYFSEMRYPQFALQASKK